MRWLNAWRVMGGGERAFRRRPRLGGRLAERQFSHRTSPAESQGTDSCCSGPLLSPRMVFASTLSEPTPRTPHSTIRELRGKRLSNYVHDREVPSSEIVKGYEFEKGRYVVLSEEDFDKVRPSRRESSISCSSPTIPLSIRCMSTARIT